MAIIEQSIDVYVNSYGIPPRIHMPQGDTGRLLRIRPEDYAIPSGATASVKFKRPNESYFSVPAVIRNNYADADATQLITTAGDVKAMLQIEKDGEVIKSFVFVVVVHANTIGAPETEEQGKTFEDYVAAAKEAKNEAVSASEQASAEADRAEGFANEAQASVVEIEGKLSPIEAKVRNHDVEIDALWKIGKGQTHDFRTVEEEGYEVDVPGGALMANVKKIGGKSVVWNQLVGTLRGTASSSGITFTNNGDGSFTVNGTTTADATYQIGRVQSIIGHKYYAYGCQSGGKVGSSGYYLVFSGEIGNDVGDGKINTATETNINITIDVDGRNSGGFTVNNIKFKPKVINLTQMFGSGNEPTSIDDERIKMIEEYAESHPEYNEGEIISAEVSEVVSRGDEEVVSSFAIPSEVQALPGYGDMLNEVIFEPTVYRKMKSVDLGTLDWFYNNSAHAWWANIDCVNDAVGLHSEYAFLNISLTSWQNDTTTKMVCLGKRLWGSYWENKVIVSNGSTTIKPSGILHYEAGSGGSDYKAKLYVSNSEKKLLKNISGWYRDEVYGRFIANAQNMYNASYGRDTPIVCSIYESKQNREDFDSSFDKVIYTAGGHLYVHDSSYSTVEDFLQAMTEQNVEIVYKIETQQILDITDLLDGDILLPTESGGSITFVNENRIGVPSTVEYAIDLSEVI